MSKNVLRAVAAAAALVGACGAQADVVAVIDLFSTSQGSRLNPITDTTANGIATVDQVSTAGDDIIGGYREILVNLGNNSPAGDNASVAAWVSGGLFTFNNGAGTVGSATVRWDGAATGQQITPNGLGSKDITGGDLTTAAFQLLTVAADHQFQFTIEAYTDATHWSKVTLTSHEYDYLTPGHTSYIPLAAFYDCGFSAVGISVSCASPIDSVDFTHLGALQVVLNSDGGTTALDLVLNQVVTTIPEPGSLALAGLALFGLGVAGKRRKAAR